jgi:ATP-dependent Zn protease
MLIITPATILGKGEEQQAQAIQAMPQAEEFHGKDQEQTAAATQGLPSDQEVHALYQQILEPIFAQVIAQVHLLDCMLQDLAFNIGNNASIPTKNRGKSIGKIREIRELLSGLQNTQFVVLNESLVNSFIAIVHTTTMQVKKALETGIDNLEFPDVNNIRFEADISFEQMQKELIINDTLIKSLTKLADSLGLHWYNKIYRNFKHYIVEPTKIVAPWALGTGIVAGAGFFLWYYSEAENPKWLRNWIKYPAVYASTAIINDPSNVDNNPVIQQQREYTQACIEKAVSQLYASHAMITTENPAEILRNVQRDLETVHDAIKKKALEKPAGFLAHFEARIKGFSSGDYALGSLFLGGATLIGKTYLPGVGKWISRNIKTADNFLMGGAYKNRSSDAYVYSSDVTFDNIIGQEDAKKYGRELCQYLTNPELFDRTKITPSTGILLFGDTRTGKSFFISALLGEIQKSLPSFKMHKISFEEILKYGMDSIMEVARYEAPVIIVIEEIDLLGLQRTNNAKLLGDFMTAMSSCLQDNTPGKTVIVIGTTNKLENLEPALRTDGRFGKHLFFDYPTFKYRKEFIEHELIKSACNPDLFDIDKLARDTAYCSFEKIKHFIKRTFLKAKLYNETVSQEALERSIDENIHGISANEVILDAEQKELIATHLAGHTVASILLDPHQKVSKVTLRDVANKIEEQWVGMSMVHKDAKQEAMEHGKVFANYDHDMPGIESKQEKIKQCKIALAGHVAETLLLGSCGYGYHPHDKQTALTIAKSITCGTLDLTTLTDKIRDQYFDEAFALMNTCEAEVKQLLEEHRDQLIAVIQALTENLTLDAKQLRKIVLGEQATPAEHLDASSILADLLKNQPELLEELAALKQPGVLTGSAAVAA